MRNNSAKESADFLVEKLGRPKIFFILGSGIDLTSITNKCEDVREISFGEIPNFPSLTVEGHKGKIVAGKFLGKIPIYLFFGRKHTYEGNVEDTMFISDVMVEIGAEIGIFTSSMGAISDNIQPGDLVLLKDIISLGGIWTAKYSQSVSRRFQNPNHRFSLFDYELSQKFYDAGEKAGICIRRGIAAFLTGPTYETLAEVNMLKIIGADVVSMSMAPEVSAASSSGIRCIGVALVTNKSGMHPRHKDVLNTAKSASRKLVKIIENFIKSLLQ